MTLILAAVGALLGLAGLVLGGYGYHRAKTAIGESHALAHRQPPETSGVDVRAIRDVAVVRYDALEEMSGARSFSLALLNAAGDGVIVTSINGRTESRTYAKTIEGGDAAEALSPEEYRAIRSARMGQGPEGTPGSDEHAAATPNRNPEAGREQPEDLGGSGPSVRPLGHSRGREPGGSPPWREVPETTR
ncbi:DUF4446 family protein [Halostreptopolyspora alba]|uniref:DUF4446 family protein n=1 Tax=Halostreptopolyspora alba TaxID=2487137 RepID=A0A3N0E6D5_9ACTN|nr:DUF4446 family protein [Nocardiopsaceae bacterium YIM 96095]